MKVPVRIGSALVVAFLLAGCQKEASLESVTAPIATPVPAAAPSIDPTITDLERVKPGGVAPDFKLTNHDGLPYVLSAFRNKKYVVLVFYRGYFCGQCIGQLGNLKSLLSATEKQNVQVIGVSTDSRSDTQNTLIELSRFPGKADFLLLEDRDHATIDRYGLFNPAEFKAGIPYPTTYVIDKQGVVTHRFVDPKTYERATNEQIRSALHELGAI
ncbi:MAG: peroxiredoxin family protein [Acidobacteriota bacterium]